MKNSVASYQKCGSPTAASRADRRQTKGRIEDIELLAPEQLRVSIRYAGGRQTIDVGRIINCTGPETDPTFSTNSLLQSLLDDGTARADRTRLGLSVDAENRIVSASGKSQDGLYAVGALTRGTHWEVTAIPDLRSQTNALAQRLLHEYELQRLVPAGAETNVSH